MGGWGVVHCSLRGVPFRIRPRGAGRPQPNRKCVPQEGAQHVSPGGWGPERKSLDPREAMLVTMSPLSTVESGSHILTHRFDLALSEFSQPSLVMASSPWLATWTSDL